MNDLVSLMLSHRSIRRYREEPVSAEHIAAAVDAGQAASTSSAVQAYCVIHVTDQQHRLELAALTGPQDKVARCGSFFVICGDTRRHRLLCESAGQIYRAAFEGFLVAVIDASLFAQNFALAFESMGYGICYIGGLRNQLSEVDRILKIPEGVYPLYGLCVGAPAEEPMARPRLPGGAVLFEGEYPDDRSMLDLIEQYDADYRSYLEQRDGEQANSGTRLWAQSMAEKFAKPMRTELGDYYRSKGADLS